MDNFIIIILSIKCLRYIFISVNSLVHKRNILIFSSSLNYNFHYAFLIFGMLLALSAVFAVLKMKTAVNFVILLLYVDCIFVVICTIYIAYLRIGRLSGGGIITPMYFFYMWLHLAVDFYIISKLENVS
jgi:hypothetical protein